jgi:hypothetical protein
MTLLTRQGIKNIINFHLKQIMSEFFKLLVLLENADTINLTFSYLVKNNISTTTHKDLNETKTQIKQIIAVLKFLIQYPKISYNEVSQPDITRSMEVYLAEQPPHQVPEQQLAEQQLKFPNIPLEITGNVGASDYKFSALQTCFGSYAPLVVNIIKLIPDQASSRITGGFPHAGENPKNKKFQHRQSETAKKANEKTKANAQEIARINEDNGAFIVAGAMGAGTGVTVAASTVGLGEVAAVTTGIVTNLPATVVGPVAQGAYYVSTGMTALKSGTIGTLYYSGGVAGLSVGGAIALGAVAAVGVGAITYWFYNTVTKSYQVKEGLISDGAMLDDPSTVPDTKFTDFIGEVPAEISYAAKKFDEEINDYMKIANARRDAIDRERADAETAKNKAEIDKRQADWDKQLADARARKEKTEQERKAAEAARINAEQDERDAKEAAKKAAETARIKAEQAEKEAKEAAEAAEKAAQKVKDDMQKEMQKAIMQEFHADFMSEIEHQSASTERAYIAAMTERTQAITPFQTVFALPSGVSEIGKTDIPQGQWRSLDDLFKPSEQPTKTEQAAEAIIRQLDTEPGHVMCIITLFLLLIGGSLGHKRRIKTAAPGKVTEVNPSLPPPPPMAGIHDNRRLREEQQRQQRTAAANSSSQTRTADLLPPPPPLKIQEYNSKIPSGGASYPDGGTREGKRGGKSKKRTIKRKILKTKKNKRKMIKSKKSNK